MEIREHCQTNPIRKGVESCVIAEKNRDEFVHELGKEKSKRISLKNHKTG